MLEFVIDGTDLLTEITTEDPAMKRDREGRCFSFYGLTGDALVRVNASLSRDGACGTMVDTTGTASAAIRERTICNQFRRCEDHTQMNPGTMDRMKKKAVFSDPAQARTVSPRALPDRARIHTVIAFRTRLGLTNPVGETLKTRLHHTMIITAPGIAGDFRGLERIGSAGMVVVGRHDNDRLDTGQHCRNLLALVPASFQPGQAVMKALTEPEVKTVVGFQSRIGNAAIVKAQYFGQLFDLI